MAAASARRRPAPGDAAPAAPSFRREVPSMGSNRIPSAAAGDHHPVKRKKRAPGLALIVRHGYFHVQGTIKVADASCPVPWSTGLQEGQETRAVAKARR